MLVFTFMKIFDIVFRVENLNERNTDKKGCDFFFKDKNNQVQNYIWSVKINVTGHCGDQNDSYSFLKILPTEFKNSKKSYKLFKH